MAAMVMAAMVRSFRLAGHIIMAEDGMSIAMDITTVAVAKDIAKDIMKGITKDVAKALE
jgi:hypothetical protein